MRKILLTIMFFVLIFDLKAQNNKAENIIFERKSTEYIEKIENLMNNNFMNLRSLHSAVINFGDGKNEFDKLLDQYSLGFAYYMEYNFKEAIRLLEKNEKDIHKMAIKLANKYKKDTENIYRDTVKKFMKIKMENSIVNNKLESSTSRYSPIDIYLTNSAHTLVLANRYLKSDRPVDAIFYFRRAKQFSFQCYEIYKIPLDSKYKRDLADLKDFLYKNSDEELSKKLKKK